MSDELNKEVKVEKIYYYRLFKVDRGVVEVGSDYKFGASSHRETLRKVLDEIYSSAGQWNHFEIYEGTPTISNLMAGLYKVRLS